MIFKNSLNFINEFFIFLGTQLRQYYLNSKLYDKKISRITSNNLEYKPSPSLLDCLVKYNKDKKNINSFLFNEIWKNKNLSSKDYKNLHSFFWLFSLDLKSSKKNVQSIIQSWINKNNNYNKKNWEINILSKRIIGWISNSKLTYEDGDELYKNKFNKTIQKQINHLINEIEKSKSFDDKMIGCAAIILTGLSFKEKEKYLYFGFNLLKKIINFSFDSQSFPKSRNLRQLVFYLKYFILIREWLKESQNEIPEYLNEIIFYLGQSYALLGKNIQKDFLFNGNHISDNSYFDNYLRRLGYNFKNENYEVGGYVFFKKKKYSLIADLGSPPEKEFSKDYQSGALSFEFISNNNKIISNSGYFQNYNHQLNLISKSTACHSTLNIENFSHPKQWQNEFDTAGVYGKNFFSLILEEFGDQGEIVLMDSPNMGVVSGALLLTCGNTMFHPYAVTRKNALPLSLNNAFYWKLIEHACEKNLRAFDMGRSHQNQGTFQYKKSWEAQPIQLYYNYIFGEEIKIPSFETRQIQLATRFWKKLPLFLTNLVGPRLIRRVF